MSDEQQEAAWREHIAKDIASPRGAFDRGWDAAMAAKAERENRRQQAKLLSRVVGEQPVAGALYAEPVQIDREALTNVLSAALWERGNIVSEWPEDEAEAYRELGWSEGDAAARTIMMGKAADAVIAHLAAQPVTGTVETVEQLDALPLGSVILCRGRAWQRLEPGRWTHPWQAADGGCVRDSRGFALIVPARVLYRPDHEGEN